MTLQIERTYLSVTNLEQSWCAFWNNELVSKNVVGIDFLFVMQRLLAEAQDEVNKIFLKQYLMHNHFVTAIGHCV